MIERLLVANRGEIARRILRSCRRLGIATVAIHSDADADEPHVREADEAVLVGPAPASTSYLAMERVIEAAVGRGVDAIHPGYGFLSENADFADACESAGLLFVGPAPATIRTMGDKAAARALVEAAGVPVVPGGSLDGLDAARARALAEEVGLPIIVKAATGGGGRGMRLVSELGDLPEAIRAARSEAESAFGDGRLLLERFVTAPHHVEVQVFGDRHGHLVHLFERECSVQRRHQKLIEEAPSPLLDDGLRDSMTSAAVDVARWVDYVGAGTVEFLVSGTEREFFFIEMNTRLQVEHPVTELTVLADGVPIDLVEWQLRVASGEPLPVGQEALRQDGVAVEARVTAEDAAKGFLPQAGHVLDVVVPQDVRWDGGVEAGSSVTSHWDSLLGKLIVHAPTRAGALASLADSLDRLAMPGLIVNTDALADILRSGPMQDGRWTTDLLDRWIQDWAPPAPTDAQAADVAAAFAAAVTDRGSPWTSLGPWRMGAAQGWPADVEDSAGNRRLVTVSSARASPDVTVANNTAWHAEHVRPFRLHPATEHAAESVTDAEAALRAPMPGSVVSIEIASGGVAAGATILVIEAMKMQHAIRAPTDGVIDAVVVAVGDTVDPSTHLVDFTPA